MKKCLFVILVLSFILIGCNENTANSIKKKETNKIEKKQKKELTAEDYKKYNVDELGEVPIMMYHGIHNKKNDETDYTGGNIDKNGYQRTVEAFRSDLDFYYQNGYRMIRLSDFVYGNINVELGKSPIILTFDDGLSNNIKVTGLDEKGNIIIDPNSAVGILEEYKKKYPDFSVTATFFVNGGLFQQKDYNEKILKWLVKNGYDIGNHSYSHVDFTKIDINETMEEIGSVYELLEKVIPGKYVDIVALPFGSPYKYEHENMKYILEGNYNGKEYKTKATLRVGWKAETSPFDKEFTPNFLKRIRAYDNNGKEFDIEMNFKLLENTRYISDGDVDNIVIPIDNMEKIGKKYKKTVVNY